MAGVQCRSLHPVLIIINWPQIIGGRLQALGNTRLDRRRGLSYVKYAAGYIELDRYGKCTAGKVRGREKYLKESTCVGEVPKRTDQQQ